MDKPKVWEKGGPSPNKNGRPKGRKNKNSPAWRLEKALSNGYDLRKLKEMALELISDPNVKLSPAQSERLLRTMFDVELKMMEMELAHNIDNSEDEDDSDVVVFKTTAD